MAPEPRFDSAVARDYDETRALPAAVTQGIFEAIAVTAGISADSRVLEAGAGTGALSAPFLRCGCRYLGVDASQPMLRQFHRSLPQSSGQDDCSLLAADMLALPFAGGTFDLLLAFRVFGVVPGWRRGVTECLRVLRPGGMLVVGRVERGPESLHYLIRHERNRLLESAGITAGRPGADDDAVLAALRAAAVAGPPIKPVAWMARTTPQRELGANLSGWRVHALSPDAQAALRSDLALALSNELGDLDRPMDERAAFVLHSFRRP